MNPLRAYSILLKSIDSKIHTIDYQLDKEFFTHFEDSIIKNGDFNIRLEIEKKPTVMNINFIIDGFLNTICDRCLTDINQKVQGEFKLLVKFGEIPEGKEEDIDLIYLSPLAQELNLANFIYEFISLSIPYSKICADEEKVLCDENVQNYLGIHDEENDSDDDSHSPFSKILKGFNKDI